MSKKRLAAAIAAVAISAGASSVKAITLDLTTAGSSGTVNGAFFQQINPQTTGTGVIEPFLRVQANGTAEGYNNDNSTPAQQFDEKTGNWTHSLLLSAVPIVNGKYQILLDINQEKHDPILNLDELQLYQSSTKLSGFDPVTMNFSSSNSEFLAYDLDAGPNGNSSVTLNYALNPGSGAGDLFIYIPTNLFTGPSPYLTLYAKFSNENDGFEEFSVGPASPGRVVPVPAAVWGGLTLLGGMGITKRLRRRNAEIA